MEGAPSEASSAEEGPLPQQQLTWLLNADDFNAHVASDEVNLCCVIVTSTLCEHSGVRRLRYPPPTHPKRDGALSNVEDANGSEDAAEDDDSAADDGADGVDGSGTASSHFFREVRQTMVEGTQNLSQRRHVRFFHVCACTVEETNIEPLCAADPSLALYGRGPTEEEATRMRCTAYKQLIALTQMLGVDRTPCMLFYLKGKPLKYSMMPDAPSETQSSADSAQDRLCAVGSNIAKWRSVLVNAVVVRNAVMREYDNTVKQKLREEKLAARAAAREERRRQRALEADNAEDEEAEEDAE